MLLTRANPEGKAEVTFRDDEIKGFGLRLREGGALMITAARREEAAGMRWSELDLARSEDPKLVYII